MNRFTKPDLTVMLLVAAALALWPVAVLAAPETSLPEATKKPAEAADAIVEAIHSHYGKHLETIYLVDIGEDMVTAFQNAIKA